MSEYIKQTWVDNETPVDAEHMNHIEDGVEAAHKALKELPTPAAVDDTLTVTGAAADAAVVGKKVTALAEEKVDKAAIVQEAGQSEVIVMSQKAVTDLVSDALGSGVSGTQYETVDSVEEMTDTSKQYVLSTTGTLWVYGEQGERPAFTNLAKTITEGYRISGSSGLVAQAGATAVEDYIPITTGDVVRIKGFGALDDWQSCVYKADKSVISASVPTNGLDGCTYEYDSTTAIATITVTGTTQKWLRVSGVLTGTTADVIITVNEEIEYVATSGWYDTGLSPEQGSPSYVNLLVKVNQNASGISEAEKRLTALEAGSGAVTIPAFWENAVDACISKIKALQVGKNCVTFPFFSDNHQRNGYAGVLIAHIMKECGIPYAFYGGDTISSGCLNENEMVEQDKAFDDSMAYIPDGRFCRAVGNHDGFWNDNGTKGWYTRAQVYELFLRAEGIAQNKHYGEDGTYYYVNDIASRVRWIILNTNSETISDGNESIDATQLAWLRDKALKVDADWGVVIISHCPISNHYHANVRNNAEVIEVINASGADVIGWFAGHIHRDRMYTNLTTNGTDGVEGDAGAALGFTEVTITSDNTGIAYDDATKHPVANDNQSHAIDFVTINKTTRTVHLTRLGIGEDRSYTY